MNDTVSIDIKGYFNLGDSTGSRSDSVKMEYTKSFIISCKFSFAL